MKTTTSFLSVKEVLAILLFLSVFFTGCDDKTLIEIYVSVEGNDSANGSITNPLATIPVAVEKVRSLRKLGDTSPATIYLRGGRHQLNKTLVLGIEDGYIASSETKETLDYGTSTITKPAHLTFTAYPNEKPVISAGVPITGWKLFEPTVSTTCCC